MHALDGWKPTAIMNWPMQSHGAEILRLACVRLHATGLAVIAPVHDAVLVEVDENVAADAAQAVVSHMQQAAAQVLCSATRVMAGPRQPDGRSLRATKMA